MSTKNYLHMGKLLCYCGYMNRQEARKIALALKEQTGMTFADMARDINARADYNASTVKAGNWFSPTMEGSPPAVVRLYLSFMKEKHLK